MQTKLFLLLALTIVLLATRSLDLHLHKLDYPDYFPQPSYDFARNPLSKEGIALGRKLFYDPILSLDSTISCAHCHLSYTAFTHVDHARSHGFHDRVGPRNSPALMNLAWRQDFMWDGAIHSLDVQALAPLQDSNEMDMSLVLLEQRLNSHADYPRYFRKVFGRDSVELVDVLRALSQFQLQLISSNAKYDRVRRGEERYTEMEARGEQLFMQHCNRCHQAPLFGGGTFADNGLSVDTSIAELGRMRVTLSSGDYYHFRVPTLRNIEYSAPYMHDGRKETLRLVLQHYRAEVQQRNSVDSLLRKGIVLTEREELELLAFLRALSDESFVLNPNFAFPRNRERAEYLLNQ